MIKKRQLLSTIVSSILLLNITTISRAIISGDNPANHLVDLDAGTYSGVAYLSSKDGGLSCTGTLLKDGLHILTAAHCITLEDSGKLDRNLIGETTATFFPNSIDPGIEIDVVDFYIHPGWKYDEGFNNDIAILKLAEPPPEEITRYNIYRKKDELGKIFVKVGYGYLGIGTKGQDETTNESPTEAYLGENRYEALPENLTKMKDSDVREYFKSIIPSSQLIFDFDNGNTSNNALGFYGLNSDLGLGRDREVVAGSGDSGGPAFIGDLVAGVTSWGGSLGSPPDVDENSDNGTYGEFGSDTRVSFYANFIDEVLAGKIPSAQSKR